jgi:hypothetical protein
VNALLNQPTALVVLAVLAVVGVVSALTAGRRATKRAARGVREVNRLFAMAVRCVLFAALITGGQWLLVTHTADPWVIVATLAVPALAAGFQLSRLFAITEVVYSTRRGGRHR